MFALFTAIFRIATVPMDWIESGFAALTTLAKGALPAGLLTDFLTDGVLSGMGATLVFLPQICLLFFLISLLEDTGYLARAAFLVDRFLRPFGLSGYAFVPLLSSHACALPGIMATRQIPDPRERLAAILVTPFMSCSARIPVYVLLTSLLFPGAPARQALAFIACYALGAVAGLLTSLLVRRTILRGKTRAMALELPTYKRPSLRTAWLTMLDRALMFLKKAGTNILAICVVLWWLSTFPHAGTAPLATQLREQAAQVSSASALDTPQALEARADAVQAAYATSQSYLGRLGRAVQPVFAPLGYDWQLSVGVLASFAAREVFASTMGVITTAGEDFEDAGTIDRIAHATRSDGVTKVFTPATSWSLLVYFVLAMQCLPTLAVTAKESGHAKWALLQLAWMCGVAYVAALVVFQIAS
jgi:ferrous iron transport protein B